MAISLEPRNPLQVYDRESNTLVNRSPLPDETRKIQEALNKLDPDIRYELMRMPYESAKQWLIDKGFLR